MPVFACDVCGDSIQKPSVEKHIATRCPRVTRLSCLDCHKDFDLESYKSHKSCVTEAERCMGGDYRPKVAKGQVKQEKWTEKIQAVIDGAEVHNNVKHMLEKIRDNDNVPRKKPKFLNFMKNIFRGVAAKVFEQIWDLISTPSNGEAEEEAEEQAAEAAAKEENPVASPPPTKKAKTSGESGESGEADDEAKANGDTPTLSDVIGDKIKLSKMGKALKKRGIEQVAVDDMIKILRDYRVEGKTLKKISSELEVTANGGSD